MTLSRSNQQRALVALVEVLGLAVWFSATAVVPTLRSEWGIGATGAVWLTASVQIGFVTGAITSAVFNLADRVTPQKLLAASALGAAACTAAIAFFATGLGSAVPMRFLTGMFLAGVYPVGMKLMASWSESADRGRAFGILIGALTLGSALPHLISGFGPLPWRSAMLAAAVLSTAAAVVALAVIRPGPHLDIRSSAPDPRHALALFAERGPRLVSFGYFGHMWELYALWTWLSTFIVAGREARGDTTTAPTGLIAFGAIGVAGVIGCLLGGWASDRFGRPPAAVFSAGDQRLLLRGLTTLLRRPDNRSRRLCLGVGCCGHRRLGRLLHGAERDDRRPVRRHRPDRADRHRFPVDSCHHPTRPDFRRPDRLALRVSDSRSRPAHRCRGDVHPECSQTTPTSPGGKP